MLVNLCLYNYINNKLAVKDIAQFTKIHISTIYRWIERYNFQSNKNIVIDLNNPKHVIFIRKKRVAYWKKINESILEYLKKYMSERTIINVKYIIKEIKRKFHIKVASSTIYKIINVNLKLSYKKVKNKLIKKCDQATHAIKVKNFKSQVNEIGIDCVFALDESHFYLNMQDSYGWSKKGEICVHNKISIIREKYSLLQIISNKKVIGYKLYKGTINATRVIEFLKEINIPENVHVLLDNARAHKAKIVKKYTEENNVNLLFNVPYSPETNPIEMVFSKIKKNVRARDNSTEDKLKKNVSLANKQIIKRDLMHFYNKSFS